MAIPFFSHARTHDIRAFLCPHPVRAHRVKGTPYLEVGLPQGAQGMDGVMRFHDGELVGGLEHQFYFPINIGLLSSSQLTKSYFSEGWPNHQPVNDGE